MIEKTGLPPYDEGQRERQEIREIEAMSRQ
jgi:hypothetical protein